MSELQSLLVGDPDFDPAVGRWTKCPKCSIITIDHTGNLGPWQGCYHCRILLNRDGHVVQMRRGR